MGIVEKMKSIFFLVLCIALNSVSADQVDVVVFSFDRPMQLYAFLESLHHYSSNFNETSVIYRCSRQEYRDAYKEVFNSFPSVIAVEQKSPPHDFRALVMKESFKQNSSDYIVFAVDDIFFTDYFDFSDCVDALETVADAYGFYLRLGSNIEDCRSSGNFEGTPPLKKVNDFVYSWQFSSGIGNWAYPNSLDMTVYRKKDIEKTVRGGIFNPNMLENGFGVTNLNLLGLCFEHSKIFNIPLNIISTTTSTAHLGFSTKYLLGKFQSGFKLDISSLKGFDNRSSHVFTYEPVFIPRAETIQGLIK